MTERLPPDYHLHDAVYQRLRQSNAIGWDGTEQQGYVDMLHTVTPLLPAVNAATPPRLLEIGCGAGNLSLLLAAGGYDVTGVDISPSAIEWARDRVAGSSLAPGFRTDSVLTLSSCAAASFDAVVDGHCLHCIVGDDRTLCLAAVRRVLKPGGVFVVQTMCGEVTHPTMLKNFDAARKVTVHGNRPTRYIGSAREILAEVLAAGFDITSWQVVPRKDLNDQDTLVIQATKPSEVRILMESA